MQASGPGAHCVGKAHRHAPRRTAYDKLRSKKRIDVTNHYVNYVKRMRNLRAKKVTRCNREILGISVLTNYRHIEHNVMYDMVKLWAQQSTLWPSRRDPGFLPSESPGA